MRPVMVAIRPDEFLADDMGFAPLESIETADCVKTSSVAFLKDTALAGDPYINPPSRSGGA